MHDLFRRHGRPLENRSDVIGREAGHDTSPAGFKYGCPRGRPEQITGQPADMLSAMTWPKFSPSVGNRKQSYELKVVTTAGGTVHRDRRRRYGSGEEQYALSQRPVGSILDRAIDI